MLPEEGTTPEDTLHPSFPESSPDLCRVGKGFPVPCAESIVINLNKPPDITSQKAVSRVKRLLGVKKAGHAGTLDPLATGVLLVCLNEATKITRFLMDTEKEYIARVKLGEKTDTGDSQGRVIGRKDVPLIDRTEIEKCATMFSGGIMQKPPMYSAVKIGGKTLHRLARKGIEIERPERRVEIYDIRILDVDLPYFDLQVTCSRGTYMRTLCEDIGTALGTGAHLTALERTRSGFFSVRESVTIGDLERGRAAMTPDGRSFFSIDGALTQLPDRAFDESECKLLRNGVPVRSEKAHGLPEGSYLRLKDPGGNLFGIGRINAGLVRVERLLHILP